MTSRPVLPATAGRIDAPLLANMTEFGPTPFHTAKEFEALDSSIIRTIIPGSNGCAPRPPFA